MATSPLRKFETRNEANAWLEANGLPGWATTYSGTGWIAIDPTDDEKVWAYMSDEHCSEGLQRLIYLPGW